jgi:hypothetical protein
MPFSHKHAELRVYEKIGLQGCARLIDLTSGDAVISTLSHEKHDKCHVLSIRDLQKHDKNHIKIRQNMTKIMSFRASFPSLDSIYAVADAQKMPTSSD